MPQSREAAGQRAANLASADNANFYCSRSFNTQAMQWGWPGVTPAAILTDPGWRAVATLADIGRASLVGRIPRDQLGLCQNDDNKTE